MRIEICEIAECLYGCHRAWRDVVPTHGGLKDIPYRLPTAAGELGKKPAVSEKMKPYPLGDGKHHLSVRNGSENLSGGELRELDLSFFLARREETAAFT